MPKIPLYKGEPKPRKPIELPSQVERAGTGLKPASEDMLTGPSKELGKVSGAISDLGEAIYLRAKQQEDEDRRIASDNLLLDYDKQESQFKQQLKEADTPDERMAVIESRDKWIMGYPDYEDLSKLDDSNLGYHGKRLKKLGWTSTEHSRYKIKFQTAKNGYDQYYAGIKADDRRTLEVQSYQATTESAAGKMREGTYRDDAKSSALDKAVDDISEQPEIYKEQNTQYLTQVYLDDIFRRIGKVEERPGDIEVVRAVKNGDFDEGLKDVFKRKESRVIIETFKNNAVKAEEKWEVNTAYNKYLPIFLSDDPKAQRKATEDIRKDKSLSSDVQKKVLRQLDTAKEREEERKNTEERQGRKKEREDFFDLVKEGQTVEASKLADEFKYHTTENILVLQKGLAEGDNPYNITDHEYFFKLYNKAIDGEIDPEDVEAVPNKLKPRDAEYIQTKAEDARSDEKKTETDLYKRAAKLGDDMIKKSTITGIFDAEEFERAYLYKHALDKALEEGEAKKKSRIDMLTVGTDDYIVKKVLKPYMKTLSEIVADKAKKISSKPSPEPKERIPEGAVLVGKTKDGKPAYRLPDGRYWSP